MYVGRKAYLPPSFAYVMLLHVKAVLKIEFSKTLLYCSETLFFPVGFVSYNTKRTLMDMETLSDSNSHP